MSETVTVAERFHGPPRSGNGGYVCGRAARFIGSSAEVTLRAPPPLETPLAVVRESGEVSLRHGDHEVARARHAAPSVTPPAAPSLAEAERASLAYRGREAHSFSTCFTCGPAHASGLHIFAGPARDALVAAPWTPAPDLAAEDGLVAEEFMWAALDCPSYWALPQSGALTCVLGRLTAAIDARPTPGDALIVAAWPLDASGRKHRAASALYSSDGRALARAEAVWIEVNPELFV